MEINEKENIRRVAMILHPDDMRILKKGGTVTFQLTSIPDTVFEVCYKELIGT